MGYCCLKYLRICMYLENKSRVPFIADCMSCFFDKGINNIMEQIHYNVYYTFDIFESEKLLPCYKIGLIYLK